MRLNFKSDGLKCLVENLSRQERLGAEAQLLLILTEGLQWKRMRGEEGYFQMYHVVRKKSQVK